MKLLVLGGTKFLGRHFVELAAADGHHVTVFHRGRTVCPLPGGVRELLGDRENPDDLQQLGSESWDVVLDTSAYYPQTLERSLDAVGRRARRYLFISSISVYADTSRPGVTEDAPVAALPAEAGERPDVNLFYGALKARCERELRDAMGTPERSS